MHLVIHGGTEMVQRTRAGAVWHWREVVLMGVLLASLIYAHFGALAGMVALWNVSPMYSYAYTVPFISAYLLWSRRDRLRRLVPKPGRLAGVSVVLAGVALLVAGRAGSIQVLEQIAFVVSLTGAVLLVFGAAYLSVAWVPLAYLLLMVPLWDALTESLHLPFQERSASIGCAVLHGLGVPAHCEGTLIALPGLTIEVARACSGVNYLVAVIALGLPLAYIYLPGVWRRVALIVSAVLVAALSNGLRVALIGLLVYLKIGSPLHGPFHVLHGLFVAGIGYLVLFTGLRFLAPPGRRDPEHSAHVVDGAVHSWRLPRPETAALIAVFVGLGTGVIVREARPVPLASALATLPARLGPWHADPAAPRAQTELWAGADAALHRRYRATNETTVDLDVAYFEVQTQSREVASFRTAGLHRRSRPVRVPLPSGGTFTGNAVLDPAGRLEALFWYELGGRTETSAYAAKLRTLVRAVTRRRSEGAAVLLRVVSTAQPGVATENQLIDLGGRVRDALAIHLARAGSDPQEGK